MGGNASAEELGNPKKRKIELHVESLLSPDVLSCEGLLDQSFHRDLILPMKLKEVVAVSDRAQKAAATRTWAD
jgi:hypothetical protein